jgi:hypothetical protein
VLNNLFPQYMTSFVVPITAFSRRTECILIKLCSTAPCASRIAFGYVGPNRTQRSVQLVSQTYRSPILYQFCDIIPAQVRGKEGFTICRNPPQSIISNSLGNS